MRPSCHCHDCGIFLLGGAPAAPGPPEGRASASASLKAGIQRPFKPFCRAVVQVRKKGEHKTRIVLLQCGLSKSKNNKEIPRTPGLG